MNTILNTTHLPVNSREIIEDAMQFQYYQEPEVIDYHKNEYKEKIHTLSHDYDTTEY